MRQLLPTNAVPRIYDAWECQGTGYILMERMFPCANPSFHALETLLQKVHDRGWVHRDIHKGNIMCDKHGAIKLIDFGLARKLDKANIKKRDLLKAKQGVWELLRATKSIN